MARDRNPAEPERPAISPPEGEPPRGRAPGSRPPAGRPRKKRGTSTSLGIGGRRLSRMSDEQILDLRFCDLDLSLSGTMVERCIDRLYQELGDRNLSFRPHFWISDEFFSPDGVPGIAIPFYLAHPRLAKLEKSQMLAVEGGRPEWCMRILRHEAGHALDAAYGLRRKRKWQRTFGLSSRPYPRYYSPRPRSKSFVLHLDWWYAQSHPLEDFAETFAVWLRPGSAWRNRYRGWKALDKLHFVDSLMKQIAGMPPPVTRRNLVDPTFGMKKTLRRHYRERREHYGEDLPDVYDRDLRRLFSDRPEHAENEAAARFLFRRRKVIREQVAKWTGQHAYTIDLVLKEMTARSRSLNLRVARPEEELQVGIVLIVTVQVMNFLHSGHHRIAL